LCPNPSDNCSTIASVGQHEKENNVIEQAKVEDLAFLTEPGFAKYGSKGIPKEVQHRNIVGQRVTDRPGGVVSLGS
jgi:hypothetical protein